MGHVNRVTALIHCKVQNAEAGFHHQDPKNCQARPLEMEPSLPSPRMLGALDLDAPRVATTGALGSCHFSGVGQHRPQEGIPCGHQGKHPHDVCGICDQKIYVGSNCGGNVDQVKCIVQVVPPHWWVSGCRGPNMGGWCYFSFADKCGTNSYSQAHIIDRLKHFVRSFVQSHPLGSARCGLVDLCDVQRLIRPWRGCCNDYPG